MDHYTVVAGIDFSDLGDLALERAFEQANHKEGSEVHVINVAHGYGPLVSMELSGGAETFSIDDAASTMRAHVESRVRAFEEKLGPLEVGRIVTHLRVGSPSHEIAQLASDLEAQVVVVGTHGRRGVSRILLGSIAEGVVRFSPCTVMVVRPIVEGEDIPKIEPPCPQCVKVRKESGGKELWCKRHSEHHARGHTYHYADRSWSSSRHSVMP